MTDAFVALDRDWRYLYVNRRAGEMLGRSPSELAGRHIWTEFPEAVGEPFHRAFEQAMREQRLIVLEDLYRPLGRWLETRIHPSPQGLTVFFQDVTERVEARQQLARSEERYRVLAHAFSSAVWITDPQGNPLLATNWSALTGRDVDDAGDVDWVQAVHPDDVDGVQAAWAKALRTGETYERTYRVKDGRSGWRHIRVRGVPVREGERIREWVGAILDVTDQVRAEEALRRAALEDALTGLPNRALFLHHLTTALGRRDAAPVAVLYVDVDGFKAVNDDLGHAAGDRVLRDLGAALREAVRPSDVVSRLSGDEFAVLCADLPSERDAVDVGERLVATVAKGRRRVRHELTASVGIAFGGGSAGGDGRTADAVLRDADAAMYDAKTRGGGRVAVFDAELRAQLRSRAVIEDDLRSRLHDGGLQLHFQPVMPLERTDQPAAEALLRWHRPDGTVVPAPEVIAVAEQTGLIDQVGARVLEIACREAAAWQAPGRPVAVAVNVSAHQLARPEALVRDVRRALEVSGLPPALLRLELTESVLMANLQRSEDVLTALREFGVTVEIDDFGTGYSSLSYLHRLPVDGVKIDRSFVAGLPEDQASTRIVEAIVGLGRAFGVRVIAEGVERPEQLAALRAAGCDAVQGFGLARPVPPADLEAALRRAADACSR